MSEKKGGIEVQSIQEQQQAVGLVEKLFDVARPSAVFADPVIAGEYTVITASDVKVGMGFGFGSGGGTGPQPGGEEQAEGEAVSTGYGTGGGGGGVASGRPVAIVSIGPAGVRVEPVVDVTTLGLALLTTLGSMLLLRNRMRRAIRK